MKTFTFKLTFLIGVFCLSPQLFSQLTLSPMFSDNMVLQQKTLAPVWGKTSPGFNVKVVPSWNKKEYIAKADDDGNWMVKIETPSAGGPYEIQIINNKTLKISNVMIGEVWLCSGQSNMEMPLAGWGQITDYEKEIKEANYPNIRLFQVEKATSNNPLESLVVSGGGWQECSSVTIPGFSATAYFFGRDLHENLNIPIGLIHTSWGGTIAEAWTSLESLKMMPDFSDKAEEFAQLSIEDPDSTATEILKNPNMPTTLYNAMIAPVVPYKIKGAIWYQGESNAGRAYQYRSLFPLMINDWRTKWGYNFPFYFVQLANFMQFKEEPSESQWAELREAQMKTLTLENTGMAVTIDIGEADDIHPKNKQDVGKRLALLARSKSYNEKVVSMGPLYDSYFIADGAIHIKFSPSESKLQSIDGKPLTGFSIAGPDKKFYWANAVIVGEQVVVSSPKVPFPLAVRYGWADNPICNLSNKTGLPASPFRTDDWPGLTSTNK
ncbi:MAG: sialate O-acetylesterase [Fermentimonas sp.]|nr:sialate O-acetylesterase [Fermentimonas sp.]